MKVLELEIFQYRNFDRVRIELSQGANIFVGRNGQGKTNLLESIYLLGYGRSFRTNAPRDCIQHGKTECRVEGIIGHGSISRRVQVEITAEDKRLLIHGRPVPLDEFLGSLHVLAFTGEHLKVVRGGPAERRSFLDRAMVTIYPGHVRHLAAYSRVLKQRNRILGAAREAGGTLDEELLASWDETLVREGGPIISNRIRYVERMKTELPAGLFGAETLKLHYVTVVSDDTGDEEIRDQFRSRLLKSRAQDMRMGFTTAGPHRDDLKMFLDGKPLDQFGSAGQQRSSLLCLYFAQMEIHRKTHDFYPVFLVDDVEAELDDERLRSFIRYLADRTQTFLTTAKENLLLAIPGPVRRFEVAGGRIAPSA